MFVQQPEQISIIRDRLVEICSNSAIAAPEDAAPPPSGDWRP